MYAWQEDREEHAIIGSKKNRTMPYSGLGKAQVNKYGCRKRPLWHYDRRIQPKFLNEIQPGKRFLDRIQVAKIQIGRASDVDKG